MTKPVETLLTSLPPTIDLSKAETANLAKIGDKKAAIDKFVKTVVEQGEARLAELNAEGREVWSKLAKAHNLDLTNVNYAISDDGTKLVPVGMNLLPAGDRP
jgi:hypothetical protein